MTFPENSVRRAAAGFSVIELMIVVTLAAVVLAIGAPNLVDYVRESRLNSTSTELVVDLSFARSEAIKRNTRVLVCGRAAGTNNCAASTNWSNGWVICYDANADGACDAGTTDDPNPIRVKGGLHETVTLTGPAAAFRFNPNGSQGALGGGTATLTLTGTWSGASTRTATVAPTGHVRSQKSS